MPHYHGVEEVPLILTTMRHKMKRAVQEAFDAKLSLDSFAVEAVESSLYDAARLLTNETQKQHEHMDLFILELKVMKRRIEETLKEDPSILRILSSERVVSSLDAYPARVVGAREVMLSPFKRASRSCSRPASIHSDMMSFFGATDGGGGSDGASDGASFESQWEVSSDITTIPHSMAVASLILAEVSWNSAFFKHFLNCHVEVSKFEQTLLKLQRALQDLVAKSDNNDHANEFVKTAENAMLRINTVLQERVWAALRVLGAKACSTDEENLWTKTMNLLVVTMAHFAALNEYNLGLDFSMLLSQRSRVIQTDVKMILISTTCHHCQSADGTFKRRCCDSYLCPRCVHQALKTAAATVKTSESRASVCPACQSTTGGRHPFVQSGLFGKVADCVLQHANILKGPLHERGQFLCPKSPNPNSTSTRAETLTEDVVASVINGALD